MSTQEERSPIIALPPYGFMTIIAKKIGASVSTVRNSYATVLLVKKLIREREMYIELYLNPKKN
ncbi:MAG: hypothetical protein ACRC3G_02185 [Bacteroidales bacterium]